MKTKLISYRLFTLGLKITHMNTGQETHNITNTHVYNEYFTSVKEKIEIQCFNITEKIQRGKNTCFLNFLFARRQKPSHQYKDVSF